jgi:hypothetical protein
MTPIEEEIMIDSLRRDRCPKCKALGLRGGPRGGESQNVFCDACKSGYNIALPRMIFHLDLIEWSPPPTKKEATRLRVALQALEEWRGRFIH